ncbi:carboxypeptidase-like regulatory domain-containing protein [Chryseobacterium nematophagum]|nr:carboxypeptidase-like regulatory domain-containing protein [Chryseobacterium nematophagum]
MKDSMKWILYIIPYFIYINTFSQQKVSGKITDEDGISLPGVTVVNMSTDQKVSSNAEGVFSIDAFAYDELRFVRAGFERASRKVLTDGINSPLLISLIRVAQDIEEVKVNKITGDLSKDSRAVAKVDKGEIVGRAVGLPQPVGKMREKPAEIKQVLLPILLGNLNVQGAYDLISGKARRQKRQYRYDDLQEHINWIRKRIDDDYFINMGIPAERISEFIEFSFLETPQVRTYVKAKNLSGALLKMEEAIPVFLKRLK